jgi:hypothetical protein
MPMITVGHRARRRATSWEVACALVSFFWALRLHCEREAAHLRGREEALDEVFWRAMRTEQAKVTA